MSADLQKNKVTAKLAGDSMAGGHSAITHITSRDNPLLKALRKLAQDNTEYRKQGRVWLEGEHLCSAALKRGWHPEISLFLEEIIATTRIQQAQAAIKNIAVSARLFHEISGLESPADMAFVMPLPAPSPIQAQVQTVVLDRVQDAGNVGSILRSAAAFGVRQVLALKGTAALWSPKVLRAGMGAHFALNLIEGLELGDLAQLQIPLLVTSSHAGSFLHQQALPKPCAWVMGHEGQGVSAELLQRAALCVRIGQPGGEESLNVAAAAAICLYSSSL
jgi:RNA methyltransferase, TrmH family